MDGPRTHFPISPWEGAAWPRATGQTGGPAPSRAYLTTDAIAAELDVHPDTVRRNWRAWRRRKGFPAPEIFGRLLRWSPEAWAAWRARGNCGAAVAVDWGTIAERRGRDLDRR